MGSCTILSDLPAREPAVPPFSVFFRWTDCRSFMLIAMLDWNSKSYKSYPVKLLRVMSYCRDPSQNHLKLFNFFIQKVRQLYRRHCHLNEQYLRQTQTFMKFLLQEKEGEKEI